MRYLYSALLVLLIPTVSFADRTIVTPSGYTMSSGYDAESFQTVTGQPKSIELFDAATSNVQFETAYVARPDVSRLSESVQTLVLPETLVTPSLSIGFKDITNSAGAFSGDGFYGRAYYLAVTKSLGNLLTQPDAHGVIVTGGLGGGAYHGLFGGVNAVLPLGLVATTEYDCRSVNYRIALQTSPMTRISVNRLGGCTWISFDFHTLASL